MRPYLPHSARRRYRATAGFTLVEALVSLLIMTAFFLASTATLNLFDMRAAKNRNAEAARVVVDDYINYLLSDSTTAPTATASGTDLDGDGIPDGVVCTGIDAGRPVASTFPLLVTRSTTPAAVVVGTLYWRVQAVGTTYGLSSNTALMQVNFLLSYTFHGQTYYYKAVTFKAGA